MKTRDIVSLIALIIVVAAALNMLFVGIFSFNAVSWMFGGLSVFSRILYILVGIAGIWLIGDCIMTLTEKRHKQKRKTTAT